MEAIKKLRDKKIFNDQSIVESMIQKNWMGSPVIKKSLLRVKKINEDDCVCEELGEADGKAYKIRYVNILTVDGQEPNELAAVYGLGPKTARFKRKNSE
jgi:hypothetical protein|tara:strand:+ start:113 stop:409 length:297 start_codon:yes stop_codon:yes gene_type:complete